IFFFAMALCVVGCGGDDNQPAKNPDNGDVYTIWDAPANPDLVSVQEYPETTILSLIVDALNQVLKLPADLPVVYAECGVANAFYVPSERTIVICYDLVAQVYNAFLNAGYDPGTSTNATFNTTLFVVFHELGHALVDFYDLPITGREEDAVDDFSTVLLVAADMGGAALDAAVYWAISAETPDTTSFADEHSLDQQRFFNIMCTVYGSNPNQYAVFVPD